MLQKIIEFSARNRGLVLFVIAIAAIGGWFSMQSLTVDAIPDLSDTQVIIYSQWDRAPNIIEDQVTYPIVTAMLGAPKVKTIRAFSDFGFSYVYVIFQDGTDLYWARSRTLEYLSKIMPQLPQGVQTQLGPDATGVGWVYQYALVDRTGTQSLAQLRTLQDWYIRYYLQSVPGVAEVAAVGGFQKQYQVQVDPAALFAYKIPITRVAEAIKEGNNEIGARVLEISGAEYMIRVRGYAKSVEDIKNIVLGYNNGTPVYIKNVATVSTGPEMRRGVADLNGLGDTVGGIVVMRYGEDTPKVIEAIKDKLEEIRPSLPKGVEIVTTYDRSDLIHRAIETLKHDLTLEMIIVSLVIIIFLAHIPSAFVPIVTLPIAVLLSFIPMHFMGLSSNIMSLGGIAIAIGAMVDAAIVVVENTHKHLEDWESKGKPGDSGAAVIQAVKEVGPSSFYALLVIAVGFLPIFALQAQEGKLFKPLAYTKNLSMFVAALLSITLAPALLVFITHFRRREFRPKWLARIRNTIFAGKIVSEEQHPLSRFFIGLYGPVVHWVVTRRKFVVAAALVILVVTVPIYFKLGSEFMPPLNEGTLLYMPSALPGMSVTTAQDLIESMDKVIKSFPEVEGVFGKSGRASTSTDSAPFSMPEITIVLKPQKQWREMKRWYSSLPRALQWPFTLFTPRFMSWEELVAELNSKLQYPGLTNAWTMPIKNRIDMLTTGVRTPIGIKILGKDFDEIEQVGRSLEAVLPKVRGTRSVFAERVGSGFFLDLDFDREAIARYGLNIAQVQEAIMSAVGGEPVSKTIEGRERYTINVRYSRDFRSNMDNLKHVLVSSSDGAQIPLGQVAQVKLTKGPAMIRDENGLIASYVYVDLAGRDVGSYVAEAKQIVRKELSLPVGTTLTWSGQYEEMARVKERLKVIVPITLFIVSMLLYANTRSWIKSGIILLAVPFSAIGAIWLLFLLGYNISIAVWVGLIALLGVDAETGIFMLLYLDLAYESQKKAGRMKTFDDLREAIYHGAVKRVRPKIMTVSCLLLALLPIMWSSTANAGADVMKRIAAPMLGGIVTSFAMELLVYPAIFAIWKNRELQQEEKSVSAAA